jgi:hypothetical protein
VEPLERDEDPPGSHAVSRLRHIRNELLERYGAAESASFQEPAHGPAVGDEEVLELSDDQIVADGAAPGFNEPAGAASAEPVAIDQFLYDRDAALHRALELRPLIERAVTDDAQAREAADELFDLIAIALQ